MKQANKEAHLRFTHASCREKSEQKVANPNSLITCHVTAILSRTN